MQTTTQKYRLIETNWGMLAYIVNKGKLMRLIPPHPHLLNSKLFNDNNKLICYDENLLPELADKLTAYFAGNYISFDDIDCDLTSLTSFTQKVLIATQKIPYGKTISYSELAKMINAPKSARAIGNALAKNPIPIVIPCHRIIRSDGNIGGYSGSHNPDFKRKLLNLEKQTLQSLKTKIQKR